MVDLRFERIAQIIAVAAVGSKNQNVSRYFVKTGALRIRFSEYVKSQIHLNIVHGLYGRWLKEYVETLWFLDGRISCSLSAEKVLRYYYSDLAEFLINNDEPIELFVCIDTEYYERARRTYKLTSLKEEVMEGYGLMKAGKLPIHEWRFAEILDFAKDACDLEKKAGSYALALLLRQYSQSEELQIIESR